MTALEHFLALSISDAQRGKTTIQWRVPAEDTERITAELTARLGPPALESFASAELIDALHAHAREAGGYLHYSGTGDDDR